MKVSVLIQTKVEGNQSYSRVLEVEKEYCLIGRFNCDINLVDSLCSKQHAILFQDQNGQLNLRDLTSTNGTHLKGRKVETARVGKGTQFRIGSTQITIVAFIPSRSALSRPENSVSFSDFEPSEVHPEVVVNQWPHILGALPKEQRFKFKLLTTDEA